MEDQGVEVDKEVLEGFSQLMITESQRIADSHALTQQLSTYFMEATTKGGHFFKFQWNALPSIDDSVVSVLVAQVKCGI